jgi:hypothetical protein
MYGSRASRDSRGSASSESGEASRRPGRAANERASPALYWVSDAALYGGNGGLTPARGGNGPPKHYNSAPLNAPPPGSWDMAPPGRPPRFASQSAASPRVGATPPSRMPPPQRAPFTPAPRRAPPPAEDLGWGAQPPPARRSYSGDAQRDYGAPEAPPGGSGREAGTGGDARLGALIADNLSLLRSLMSGGAVPGAEAGSGDAVGELRSSLPRRASSWNSASRVSVSSLDSEGTRWESPPQRGPGRESYGGSAVGVTTVPWPPPPPARVSEAFSGFLRPGPPQRHAHGIAEHGDDDGGAAPDALAAALQRRLQQQARELDDARHRAEELEAALEAAHAQADQAIAATAATAAAAASAADAAMSSPALAALLHRVEAAETRAARAAEDAEARAAEAEERAAHAEERCAEAEARAEAAASDARARISAATSDAMRVQVTQRHFDTATNAAAEAIAAAEARAAEAEAALEAAAQAVDAAEARAHAAEAEIPVLRRAAAAAEQALASDRETSRQLTGQLAALTSWSQETAAELRELRATAARSLTPPPGAQSSSGALDGLLAAAVRAS